MSTLKNKIFLFLILIQIQIIFSENDKCYSISHCKKCPNSDKCEQCEIGYKLSSDYKNCLSISDNNVGSLRKTSSSSSNSTNSAQKSASMASNKGLGSFSMNNNNNNPYSSQVNKSLTMANQFPATTSAKNSSLQVNNLSPVSLGQNNPNPNPLTPRKDVPLMNNLEQPKPIIPKPKEHPLASFRPMPSNTFDNFLSRFPLVLMIILLIILIGMTIYYCRRRYWNTIGYFYDESGIQDEGTRVVYIR